MSMRSSSQGWVLDAIGQDRGRDMGRDMGRDRCRGQDRGRDRQGT